MKKIEDLKRLTDSGLVAVIRRPKREDIRPIAEALVAGGVGALEITLDTEGALEAITELKRDLGDKVLVGAGTVIDKESAKRAIEHGSDFIFSPIYDVEMIQLTVRYGKISIPGVMTPTEILKAYEAGADILKIFPGGTLGASYIKDLQGPMAHIPIMPTGGVNLENVQDFINNGAVAVGVGGSLLDKNIIADKRWDDLRALAQAFTDKIQEAKGVK
ncbi:bifunctional 4-hydroxy-2-oxoglutarate aldolase/2-dehydro-3-deoxy-phosphogluconate aldolase [Bacillus sp. Marseille-P3661]|uniref:bifunctional 4-hydroxy-2-oxoglutarate aldolase/2-dehydro-3-deoxy-phosphogluconate aldolase n=1 Tax=Bacillus sp. Marseille-P3661 TaxID=1936234 RepID=UPI000C81A03D|nr:bifunctional 4-hydroxy-2-oxoglutarate aldolase/2-dehydro-3-deoxy-phosphogluconate aldolase [Bacillus sp. Marseille-P3661]